MVNRDDIVAVLRHWFPNVSEDVVDGAAGEIADLPDEWEEVTSKEEELGYHYSAKCVDICYLADQVDRGAEFRLFRKRRAKTWQ